jgi:ribosomal protein S18 acetylase RimI-like enzyme
MAASNWTRAAAAGLSFRPASDDDLPFLAQLYASTRTEELAPVPWPEEQKAAFLAMQFQAQHIHYHRHYPTADWLIVLRDDAPVGRVYVERWEREHRLIDIAFLPDQRGMGYGASLLQDLMDDAAADGKPLSTHVEKFNPAMRLYLRLGFVAVEDKGVYELLRWTPPSAPTDDRGG